MSMHPSLAASDKLKKQRSVLKRVERLKAMKEKKQWKEGDPVYHLPKIKTVRIKLKKAAAEKPQAEGAAAEAAAPAAAAVTPEKKQEKKAEKKEEKKA